MTHSTGALVRTEITPDPATVEKVRVALDYTVGWMPDPFYGETATHLVMWSQMELNDLYERVGGAVTSRRVERSTSDGTATWTATELTLTVQVPDVGPVEIVTDLEDDPEHGYRTDVPVVTAARRARYEFAADSYLKLAAADDYDRCLNAADEMVLRLRQIASTSPDLIRVA